MSKARYYMIGGFLGSGKTTALAALGKHLVARGLRVGLITNDQGSALADTRLLRSRGFPTEEIPGGCFCCRFNSLLEATKKLAQTARPEAFVAEPVGSCTDLVATVTYPLRRLYDDHFDVAPLSVLVEPIRACQILGLQQGRSFSPKVLYIWRKQLEEADLLVISKSDLLDDRTRVALRDRLESELPGKVVLDVSVRTGLGVPDWFHRLDETKPESMNAMDIDYDVYAEGEALLGWLNATIRVECQSHFSANAFLSDFASDMSRNLADYEIAHLKMTFCPDKAIGGEIAAISVVRSGVVPELTVTLDEPVEGGELIVNCRGEAKPQVLRTAMDKGLRGLKRKYPFAEMTIVDAEQFQPGRPNPTHRIRTLT